MIYKDFIKKGNNLTSIDANKRAKPLKILLFILYKIRKSENSIIAM